MKTGCGHDFLPSEKNLKKVYALFRNFALCLSLICVWFSSSIIMKPRKISSRFYEYEVPDNEQGKVNSPISKQETNGGAINVSIMVILFFKLEQNRIQSCSI